MEQEAVERLQRALQLKRQLDLLQQELEEIKGWFKQNYPQGLQIPGVGRVIIRHLPKYEVDVLKVLPLLNKRGMEDAIRLQGLRHTIVQQLQKLGHLPQDLEGVVTLVGEVVTVEFR